jgi:hypothetical protein
MKIAFRVVTVALTSLALVGIPVAGHAAAAGNKLTTCLDDNTVSVQTCLTIEWNSYTSGSTPYAEMVNVHAHVSQLDEDVVVTRLKVGAVVQGRCLSGCSDLIEGKTLASKANPLWGTNYGAAPPWSKDYTTIATGGALYTCGVFQANLKRRQDTWNYTGDFCVGSAPDALSISDRERGLD